MGRTTESYALGEFKPPPLPVELYLRFRFDDTAAATEWADRATQALAPYRRAAERGDDARVVIFAAPRGGSGQPEVYVSEYAMRAIRAARLGYQPRPTLVSVSDIPLDLSMWIGHEVDRELVQRLHPA